MTTDEIRERLLSPNWPLTPERFAKAKALAMRSKRPGAFLELIQALPEVKAEMVEQAHAYRIFHLRRVIAQTADQPVTPERLRMLKSLQASEAEELASHAEWKGKHDAE